MGGDMIERVAKAMLAADKGHLVPSIDPDDIFYMARAAIEAMRDPHPIQLYPGVHAYIEVESTCRPVAFRAGWNAVIDAALHSKAQGSRP